MIVPKLPASDSDGAAYPTGTGQGGTNQRMGWARLLKRVFNIDAEQFNEFKTRSWRRPAAIWSVRPIAMPFTGRIAEVNVKRSQDVRQGDVLATADGIRKAVIDVQISMNRLRGLIRSDRVLNVAEVAETEVEEAICQRLEDALDRVNDLKEVRCQALEGTAIMVALLIGLGLLMDDAIVISENIATHLQQGKSALHAAADDVNQVMPGVIPSFLTTLRRRGWHSATRRSDPPPPF